MHIRNFRAPSSLNITKDLSPGWPGGPRPPCKIGAFEAKEASRAMESHPSSNTRMARARGYGMHSDGSQLASALPRPPPVPTPAPSIFHTPAPPPPGTKPAGTPTPMSTPEMASVPALAKGEGGGGSQVHGVTAANRTITPVPTIHHHHDHWDWSGEKGL